MEYEEDFLKRIYGMEDFSKEFVEQFQKKCKGLMKEYLDKFLIES